jgi:hypothetical protein
MNTGEAFHLPIFFSAAQDDRENLSEETSSGILPDLSMNAGDDSLIFADRVWSAVEEANAALRAQPESGGTA